MEKYIKWLNSTYPSGRFKLVNNKVIVNFNKVCYTYRATDKQLAYIKKVTNTTKCVDYIEYISKYLVSAIITLHKAYPQLQIELKFTV